MIETQKKMLMDIPQRKPLMIFINSGVINEAPF